MTIKNIVLSGGAYKGFYTIGALKYLSENNFYNINDIEKMLPHRFPFLMVDKIMEINEDSMTINDH